MTKFDPIGKTLSKNISICAISRLNKSKLPKPHHLRVTIEPLCYGIMFELDIFHDDNKDVTKMAQTRINFSRLVLTKSRRRSYNLRNGSSVVSLLLVATTISL